MKVSNSRFHRPPERSGAMAIPRICFSMLATVVLAGNLQAANLLTATPSSVTLSCNTATGPGASVSIVVKPVTALSGSSTLAVTLGSLPAGIVAVTTPSNQTLSSSNSSTGLTYVLNYAAGCGGATAGSATPTFRFNAGGSLDVTINATTTVTASATALSATPSPVTIGCVKSGSTYTPAPAKTVSITSAASGGTPFTVDTSTSPFAAWLVVNPTSGGTATSTANTFTLQAAAGCGGFSTGSSNTTTIHLLNAPAPDKTIPVTLQILTPTPLSVSPSAPSLSYTKGSGSAGKVDVTVSSAASPAPFFSVDTSTLPIWLTVDTLTGTVPKTIRFSSTNVADTLAPGTYSAVVNLKVSGSGDLQVPISLLVTNPAPRLTVAEGTTRNITWTVGQPVPTPTITAVSSDSPISYSITTGGTLSPQIAINQLQGLAYNFGTPISVGFDPLLFAAAQPGTVLTGTVTLKWGNPVATIVVTFNVTIQSPGATVTSITPASIPTATAGQTFTVVLTGTGFVPSTDPTQKTKLGIVAGGVIVPDTNIATSVVNASNMILTITVPATSDAYLPFSPTGNGGAVNLGVCNPAGSTCSVPTGTATLTIGSGPIIQAVTSASSFMQVTPGTNQTIAPYDMASIFGTNFCSSNGTGCSSSQILYGTPDATLRYPTFVSPDAAGTNQRQLSVKFQTHATPPVLIANAPILFATNNQINILVPSAVAAQIGNAIDMVVSFGYGSGSTILSSTPYPVNIAATNPGVFTIGADGQGQGAIMNSADYSIIASGREAGMRSTATDSDTVLIYVTGLGAPDSAADNATSGSSSWSADCITTASYLTSLNSLNSTSISSVDGAIIQSALLNSGRLTPCVTSSSANVPSVTFGGVAGTVSYAGWVSDSVAGLYQLNVKLPGSQAGPFTDSNGTSRSTITAPVQLPVVVTANGRSSQTGVSLWVAPRLKVTAPTTLSGRVGTAWANSNNAVTATEGSGTYRYAVTSGLLPAGLSLNATTGAITGIPAANTGGSYIVTVTATDYAAVPVSGTVTFTLTIAQGLYVTASGTPPFTGTASTAVASLTTVTATGGVGPYTYSIQLPSPAPTGISIDPTSGVVSIANTATTGTYHMTILATDSTSGTALTGRISFDITLN